MNIPDSLVPLTVLPDHIDEVEDSILQEVVQCPISKRLFRIVESELAFYRKHHLPLPVLHPDIRFQQRMHQRAGRNLYVRTCDKT